MSAECILNRDVLIIFEDHGLDTSSRNAVLFAEPGHLRFFGLMMTAGASASATLLK